MPRYLRTSDDGNHARVLCPCCQSGHICWPNATRKALFQSSVKNASKGSQQEPILSRPCSLCINHSDLKRSQKLLAFLWLPSRSPYRVNDLDYEIMPFVLILQLWIKSKLPKQRFLTADGLRKAKWTYWATSPHVKYFNMYVHMRSQEQLFTILDQPTGAPSCAQDAPANLTSKTYLGGEQRQHSGLRARQSHRIYLNWRILQRLCAKTAEPRLENPWIHLQLSPVFPDHGTKQTQSHLPASTFVLSSSMPAVSP